MGRDHQKRALSLRNELLERQHADQEPRQALTSLLEARGSGLLREEDIPSELSERLREVDAANTAFMRELVAEIGWPAQSIVGSDGASAAWLLVQHADRQPSFQRECLQLLEQAVQAGEASPRHLAYLTDRVLLAEGRPQRYGTQFEFREGRFEPRPLEDPANVDERRAELGLDTLEDNRRRMNEKSGLWRRSSGRVYVPN